MHQPSSSSKTEKSMKRKGGRWDDNFKVQLTLAYEKPLKMLCNQPARRRSSKSSCEALGAVRGLNLNAKGAKDVDAPARPRLPVLLILRHRRRNLRVYQPMAAVHVVIVSARARSLGDEGADMLNSRKTARGGRGGSRRHGIHQIVTNRGTKKR